MAGCSPNLTTRSRRHAGSPKSGPLPCPTARRSSEGDQRSRRDAAGRRRASPCHRAALGLGHSRGQRTAFPAPDGASSTRASTCGHPAPMPRYARRPIGEPRSKPACSRNRRVAVPSARRRQVIVVWRRHGAIGEPVGHQVFRVDRYHVAGLLPELAHVEGKPVAHGGPHVASGPPRGQQGRIRQSTPHVLRRVGKPALHRQGPLVAHEASPFPRRRASSPRTSVRASTLPSPCCSSGCTSLHFRAGPRTQVIQPLLPGVRREPDGASPAPEGARRQRAGSARTGRPER